MSWIMNSIESRIAPTIAYYTKARDMWSFLKKTYSHATNVIKILQLEEELCNIRQGDQDLSQYFAMLTAACERLKALRPPCKHCYASHFETGMVAKFLSWLSSEYSVAKSQILTGSDLPDLADTYNKLSRLAVTLSQPTHDIPVSALVISGGRGHSSFASTRGVAWWRENIIGKRPSSSNAPSSQATASMVEFPTSAPSYSLNLSKEEYDLVLAQRSSLALYSAFTIGAPTTDPGMNLQTGKTIGGGYEREGLYFLSTPVNVAASSFTSKPTPLQWHLRLGHPSVSKLCRMFPDIPASESFLCEACQLGKHTRSRFPSSQSPSSKSPFDLLHVDVWGPSRVSFRSRFWYYIVFVDDFTRASWFDQVMSSHTIPSSHHQALLDSRWKQAMQEEMDDLLSRETWDLVDPPLDYDVVGSKWAFTIKYHSDGSIEQFKARLVAKGYTQTYGVDFFETFFTSGKVRYYSPNYLSRSSAGLASFPA
ncbi:uncharacterized protein LOC116255259 [Nymphaea colorata]|nr:uncharacterized protein LOC116255259 [Nymphaea colorata]